MTSPTPCTSQLRQRGTWLSVNAVFPPESASRVACTLLREFAGRRYTPLDLDVTGEVKRFSYHGDEMTLLLRRVGK